MYASNTLYRDTKSGGRINTNYVLLILFDVRCQIINHDKMEYHKWMEIKDPIKIQSRINKEAKDSSI